MRVMCMTLSSWDISTTSIETSEDGAYHSSGEAFRGEGAMEREWYSSPALVERYDPGDRGLGDIVS